MMMQHSSASMQECIRNCQECHAMCLSMASGHCLEMGGKHVEPSHLRTMLACAEICQTSANFMLLGTPLHTATCGVCAQACQACAESCQALGDMDECAQACRKCADSCRAMASMA